MSRGHGRIQRAILEALTKHEQMGVDELVVASYDVDPADWPYPEAMSRAVKRACHRLADEHDVVISYRLATFENERSQYEEMLVRLATPEDTEFVRPRPETRKVALNVEVAEMALEALAVLHAEAEESQRTAIIEADEAKRKRR